MKSQNNIHNALINGIKSSSIGDVSWKIRPAAYKLTSFPQSVSNPNLMKKKEDRVANIPLIYAQVVIIFW